jgi:hypothetical protein
MKTNEPDLVTMANVQITCGKTGDGLSATIKRCEGLPASPMPVFELIDPPEFVLKTALPPLNP